MRVPYANHAKPLSAIVLLAIALALTSCSRESRVKRLLRVLENKAGVYGVESVCNEPEFRRLTRVAASDADLLVRVVLNNSPVWARVGADAIADSDNPSAVDCLTTLWLGLDDRVKRAAPGPIPENMPALRETENIALGNACGASAAQLLRLHAERGTRPSTTVLQRMLPDTEDGAVVYGPMLAQAIVESPAAYVGDTETLGLLVRYAKWRACGPARDWPIVEPVLAAIAEVALPEHVDELNDLQAAVPLERRPAVAKIIERLETGAQTPDD